MKNDSNDITKDTSIKTFVFTQIVLVLILLFVAVFSFNHSFSNFKRNAMILNEKTVYEVSRQLDSFMQAGNSFLSSTAESLSFMLQNNMPNSEIKSYLSHLSSNKLNGIASFNSGFYGYFNNQYIDGRNLVSDTAINPTQESWYISALLNENKVSVIPPHFDAKTGKFVISLSKMLYDKISVISADIQMDDVQFFANSVVKNNSDILFIADSNGIVLGHSKPGEQGKNYYSGLFPEEADILTRARESQEEKYETSYQNKTSIITSKSLFNDWVLVMITDENRLAKAALYEMIFLLPGFGLIFLLVCYFCTSNFQGRVRLSKYAKILNKHKIDLEHQVIDQWNQLDKKNRDLVEMQESVIEGMATIIEYRDVNTGMHVQHTKHYVKMITDYLYRHHLHSDEVNERYVSMIGNAAAMHDIGKVAISDRILNKPAKLDEDEYEMMKQHTILGAGLVRQVFGKSIDEDMLRICIDVVQYHHEKWDGSGYPIGLVEGDIPLSARIMAIADVFDAIVSHRVYKDSVPADEVFEIIKKEAGSHFDPELAEIFLSMKDQVKEYLQGTILS